MRPGPGVEEGPMGQLARKLWESLFLRSPTIIITGCGRSGTKYAATLISQATGRPFGHEAPQEDGTAAWQLAPLPRIPHTTYLHQVRHPLGTISSMQTASTQAWKYIEKFIKLTPDLTINCMRYWYYWNLIAQAKADLTYKVEAIEEVWPTLRRLLGIRKGIPKLPPNINSRRNTYTPLTWELLEQKDPELTKQIKALARLYGYKDIPQTPKKQEEDK